MPRVSRKDLTGEYFHVMVQGINKEYIFIADTFKNEYKKLLRHCSVKFNLEIIAYTIMNNHVHILFHSSDINSISKCMHQIDTIYGIYYNKQSDRVGYVFRNRFNLQPIKNFNHLKSCIIYIHKNPIKANLVRLESQYEYSSYNEYIISPDLINTSTIETLFGKHYIDTFISLHKYIPEYFYDYSELDISESINYKQIIHSLAVQGFSDIQIAKALYNHYKLSQDKISKILNISTYKVKQLLQI